jgi:hypothetical protein
MQPLLCRPEATMYPCDFCHEPAAHLTDSGQAIVCDECILSGKLAFWGLTEPANPGIDGSMKRRSKTLIQGAAVTFPAPVDPSAYRLS